MADFLLGAAGIALLTVLAGLWRMLKGPAAADRMIAVQLLGSGGIATLLLVAAASAQPALLDVALALALLGGLASVAFVLASRGLGE